MKKNGLHAKTTRIHKEGEVIHSPICQPNGCRNHVKEDAHTVKLLASLRRPDFSPDCIREIEAMPIRCEAHCQLILDSLSAKPDEFADQVCRTGLIEIGFVPVPEPWPDLSNGDVDGKNCV